MKRILLLLLVLMAVFAFAQEERLIGDKIESGGFGGPVWKGTRLNGESAFITGGRGGWVINHTFVIGGGGYNTLGDVKTNLTSADGKALFLRMEYSGLEIEYIHHSDKLVHWTAMALFGGGRVRLREHDPGRETQSDGFSLVDAGVNAELNILKWLRVNAGAGYRMVFGIETSGLSNADIGGPEAQVTLKFGSF